MAVTILSIDEEDVQVLERHSVQRRYYSQGRELAAWLSDHSLMNRTQPHISFDSLASAERQIATRSYDSILSNTNQPSADQSHQQSLVSRSECTYPSYDPRTYESVESLFREARNLRPLYDNLYEYEAYGDDAGERELVRRMKAFYRRHKPTFLLIEFMIQFGLCTLALSL